MKSAPEAPPSEALQHFPTSFDEQRALVQSLEVTELEALSAVLLNELRLRQIEIVEWPKPWMRVYLERLREVGVSAYVCKELREQGWVGPSERNINDWRKKNEAFDEACLAAKFEGDQMLLGEAVRRATGYKEELTFKGEKTGQTVTKFSDNLLMFCIKARFPQYKDSVGAGQVNINNEIDVRPVIVIPDNGRAAGRRELEVGEARRILSQDAGADGEAS
jgi:hypothetical protein